LNPMRDSSSSEVQWLSNAVVRPPAGSRCSNQAARGGDLGFEEAQRSGRGVARIGEAGKPALVALRVQPFERAPVHDRLAAHLERGSQVSDAQGRERMVRAFSVTSSPTEPSPRVTACTSRPSRYERRHGKPVQFAARPLAVIRPPPAVRARGGRNRAVRRRTLQGIIQACSMGSCAELTRTRSALSAPSRAPGGTTSSISPDRTPGCALPGRGALAPMRSYSARSYPAALTRPASA